MLFRSIVVVSVHVTEQFRPGVLGVAEHDGVRAQDRVVAEADGPLDDGVGADLDVLAEDRGGVDDGGGVDASHVLSSATSAKLSRASATSWSRSARNSRATSAPTCAP